NIFLIPIAVFLSLFHLVILAIISHSLLACELSARRATLVTILITNASFCGVVILLWLGFIISGQQTACVGYKCYWVKGSVTWLGVPEIGLQMLFQVMINMSSVVAVYLSRANSRKTLIPQGD